MTPARRPTFRPAARVPQALDVPADEGRSLVLLASGVQVYECHADPQAPDAPRWALRGPEATLSDDQNHVVGRHGPGLAWEATDGTRLAGVVRHKLDAPAADAIPWLLVETRPAGARQGLFAGVHHVQRVATRGGMPPSLERCTPAHAGEVERVPFEAQFWFWSARWSW